ncbi:uncharacterized protein [Amphiura filiformis]|uniref:uncharacterized protein n=1 Tax=Amphiura filiformis TaxID=82378 RepID=UPI003B22545F
MVKSCCISCCTKNKRNSPSLSFYLVPSRVTEPGRREIWLRRIDRRNAQGRLFEPNSDYNYICSHHFVKGKKSNDIEDVDYAPSLFLNGDQENCSNQILERHLRAQQRNARNKPTSCASQPDIFQADTPTTTSTTSAFQAHTPSQPDTTFDFQPDTPNYTSQPDTPTFDFQPDTPNYTSQPDTPNSSAFQPAGTSPSSSPEPDRSTSSPDLEIQITSTQTTPGTSAFQAHTPSQPDTSSSNFQLDTPNYTSQPDTPNSSAFQPAGTSPSSSPEPDRSTSSPDLEIQTTSTQTTPIASGFKTPLGSTEREDIYTEMDNLRRERDCALDRIAALEDILLKSQLSSQNVENDNTKCKLLTGLAWDVFIQVFLFLCTFYTNKSTNKHSIPLREQFFLTLVKLRHGVSFDLLAAAKCIKKSTAVDYFWKWLELLHAKIGFLIKFQDRENIFRIIPLFLDHRDQILADRGFTLQEEFATACGVSFLTPAFTKGKKQLSAEEIETSRQISSVRIHIERIIGLLKNRFSILKGTLPIQTVQHITDEVNDRELASIDRIVQLLHVTCMSVNPDGFAQEVCST